LIDTRDMAKALEWAFKRNDSKSPFLAINVGSERANYQVIEIAAAVKKLIPKVKININSNAQPDKRSYKVDFSLYKTLAPYHQPQFTIEKTTIDLIEQIKSVNFDLNMHRESSLIRLKMLKSHRIDGRINNSLLWI
jgi:nucleoside-diphosphate-sugar epimerase